MILNTAKKSVVCWVIALKAEASIIINYYNMKLVSDNLIFPIYKCNKDSHYLIISGIGQINAACATIYLNEKIKAPPWTIWINIGIAGCGNAEYGALYSTDKINLESSTLTDYPSCQFSYKLPLANLLTVHNPSENYKNNVMFDMEGAAFFKVASNLVSKELIIILKIISDGPTKQLSKISKETIKSLFNKNIGLISEIVSDLEKISETEGERLAIPEIYNTICGKWHFSFTEKKQLETLINSLVVMIPTESIIKEISTLNSSKLVLAFLRSRVQEIEIDWRQF